MIPPVATRLRVHVLIHRGDQHKPSSTGALVARAVDDATCHVYQRKTRFCPAAHFPVETLVPGGELWIPHPTGDPLPGATDPADEPRRPHVLQLDGTWRQAGETLRSSSPSRRTSNGSCGHTSPVASSALDSAGHAVLRAGRVLSWPSRARAAASVHRVTAAGWRRQLRISLIASYPRYLSGNG
jgi:hypothetical protein